MIGTAGPLGNRKHELDMSLDAILIVRYFENHKMLYPRAPCTFRCILYFPLRPLGLCGSFIQIAKPYPKEVARHR
jgi:hypothetical protein